MRFERSAMSSEVSAMSRELLGSAKELSADWLNAKC